MTTDKMPITLENSISCLIGSFNGFYIRTLDMGTSFNVAPIQFFDRWAHWPNVTNEEAAATIGIDVNTLAIWAAQ